MVLLIHIVLAIAGAIVFFRGVTILDRNPDMALPGILAAALGGSVMTVCGLVSFAMIDFWVSWTLMRL